MQCTLHYYCIDQRNILASFGHQTPWCTMFARNVFLLKKKVNRAMAKMTIAQLRTNDDAKEHRARLCHLRLLPISTTHDREK